MQSDLKNLLALQDDDRAIMIIEEEMRVLEPELAQLDEAVAELEADLAQAQADLEDSNGKRQELETRIETYRVMQERRRQKLEWVRGAKEASALMAEIDLARGVLAQEETEWIGSAEEVTEIEKRTIEAEQKVAAEKETQAPRREEIANIQRECQARVEEARSKRGETAKEVLPNLLTLYGRILRGRAPLAMYGLHNEACGHCFTAVPTHLRQQVRRGDLVATCEACGVIMYVPE